MKRLIVTADDFGAAREVNEAVEAAHRSGILTAASLMVSAPEAADAVARARRMPALRVGLHVVLVEGRPVLPAARLTHLVDGNGMLRSDMAALGAAIAFRGQAQAQVAAEITAQFEAFRATGLSLDHCNAHKHFHLHPVVGALIASIGARFGLRAARAPIEPRRVLRRVERQRGWAPAWLSGAFALLLRRRLRAAGIVVPDHVFGLRWSGQMTTQRLSGLIRNLPDGLSEIYLHPATGPYPGSAPGYRYREELDALVADEVAAACRDASLRLGGFGDFLGSQAPSRPGPSHGAMSKGSLLP
ncbi:MAG TPA: hopanoid biosynthesis-associated protein HpnK [Steroidobacteraceae bacterium]|nr:hopanoid biosynthesis-associated protein HpnK [Steroidobacteraceae bacterium]